MKNDLAICCMSGGYKSVFTHGVLAALEENKIRADAYACCSSSTLISAMAAFGSLYKINPDIWEKAYNVSCEEGNTQSDAMLYTIRSLKDEVINNLWLESSSRLLITTSYVKSKDAAAETQSDKAKRLGQRLLIDSVRKRTDWRDENLEMHLYDTRCEPGTFELTKDNFTEVAYATTRMLHAWHIPAEINGKPYIDGSYTSLCSALQIAGLGFKRVICILTEHGSRNCDFFSDMSIPDNMGDTSIKIIQPDTNLKELGIDYYDIQENGLKKVFDHGYNKGLEFYSSIYV